MDAPLAAVAGVDPPKVLDRQVRFRLADPDHRYSRVRLECDPAVPAPVRELVRRDGRWELRIPRPPLRRLEYRFGVAVGGAEPEPILDPANPLRVPTAFGDRSVLELPGYRAPAWLSAPQVEGSYTALAVHGETSDRLPITVWSPADSVGTEAMPLLVVQDGPEYDELACLSRYSAALIASGALPRHRLALVHPVRRDAWYSGSPQFLRTLLGPGLDAVQARYAVRSPVAVMGASLGGLTALHAGLQGAPRVGAVFSQSGSFFRVRHGRQEEAGFRYFDRICRQVRAILDARHTAHPLRIGLTCGALEENAADNRVMATALARAGHRVDHVEVDDLHNYTAWRDCLDPLLADVLRDCWLTRG